MTIDLLPYDASPVPPAAVMAVPGRLPQAGKGGGANDSGALWWDHDDPGKVGDIGATGLGGFGGVPGAPGADTPFGLRIIINQSVTGSLPVLIKAGNGQPGGMGGKGGPGGQGGDGGDGDDEQPPGNGGQGGNGGTGGPGGDGGKGGNIYGIDIIVGNGIPVSLINVNFNPGIGADPGQGGPGGDGGPGGNPGAPSDSSGQVGPVGFTGGGGPPGQRGSNGAVQHVQILVG